MKNKLIQIAQVFVCFIALTAVLNAQCPDLTGIAVSDLMPIITESTCEDDEVTLSGGSIAAPATNPCPAGSTLVYSENFGQYSTTLPNYTQTAPTTMLVRCQCDTNGAMSSDVLEVTTVPGECPECVIDIKIINAEECINVGSDDDPYNDVYFADIQICYPSGACAASDRLSIYVGGSDYNLQTEDIDCDGTHTIVGASIRIVEQIGYGYFSGANCTSTVTFPQPDIFQCSTCHIVSLEAENYSECVNDNFTADITVCYNLPPATGDLNLDSPFLNTNVPVSSLGMNNCYTFSTVQLQTNNAWAYVYFSDGDCDEYLNIGPGPNPCIPCPDLNSLDGGALNLGYTDSTCEADGTTLSGGTIEANPQCPVGSSPEYSLDGFATPGTSTLPAYVQNSSISVSLRCVCDSDPTVFSSDHEITTEPGTCDQSCSIENIEFTPTCKADGTYDLEVCMDHTNPESDPPLVDINVNGLLFGGQMLTGGCVTLSDASFVGDGTTGISVTITDFIVNVPDCSMAPEPIVYIASSEGSGDGSCLTGGEFIEIGVVGCDACAGSVDLAGYTIEDNATNPPTPGNNTILIQSGSLLIGETVIIYSGYLDGTLTGPAMGSMGSAITITSTRALCPVWNNSGGDDAFLYDASGTLIDTEATINGQSTYASPSVTGCPTESTTDCTATINYDEPNCNDCPDFVGLNLPVGVTESTCAADEITLEGGLIVAAPECPTGSTLEYSLDGFATLGTSTIPTYDQCAPITVSTRCVCDADATIISPVTEVTTVPGECDGCQTHSDATVGLDRNDWNNGTTTNHSEGYHLNFDLPDLTGTCTKITTLVVTVNIKSSAASMPDGCFIGNYFENLYLDTGTLGFTPASEVPFSNTGSAASPTDLSATFEIDCSTVDIPSGGQFGYDIIPAAFGTCPNVQSMITDGYISIDYSVCVEAIVEGMGVGSAPPAVISSESTCEADGSTLSGGVIDAPATDCGTGSTLQYSTDGTTWSTTLPTYDQTTAVTVMTRCLCDIDNTVSSAVTSVTTVPGECTPAAMGCLIENITTMSTCNADGTYSLEVCFDHIDPLTANGLVDVTVNGISFPMQMPTAGCVTLTHADFMGDGSTNLSVTVEDTGGVMVDCTGAPAPVVYIVSSEGTGDGTCSEDGEFIEIGVAGCLDCGGSVDLAGYTIEDNASNPPGGSQMNTMTIQSGSLLVGETVILFSGYLDGSLAGPAIGSMGSALTITSARAACPVWNGGGDDAFLYDAAGTLVDTEATAGGYTTYDAPVLTGCPVAQPSTCIATSLFDAPACCQAPVAVALATCSDGTDEAGEGFYYIEIMITDLGTDTDGNNAVDVSFNGGSLSFSATGIYYLGPLPHSGGSTPPTINFQNEGESCSLDLIVGEVICGYNTSGGMSSDGSADDVLHASGPGCDCDAFSPGYILAQVAPGSYDATTSSMVYILVDGAGNIATYNQTGLFTGLSNQSYDVHPFNVANINLAMFINSIPATGTAFASFVLPDLCIEGCGIATFALDCDCAIDCGTLACNDAINITVDENCEVPGIGLDNLLEGAYGDEDNYTITITAPDGTVVDYAGQTTSTSDDVFNWAGQQLTYMVSCEGNSCWGHVTLEDKTPPTLNCDCPEGGEDLDGDGTIDGYAPECVLSCYDVAQLEGTNNLPSDIADFVANSIEDNCQNYVVKDVFFEDNISDGPMCAANLLRRTWTVVFETANGTATETVSCTREYQFQPISVVDVHAPDDPDPNTLYRPELTVTVNCLSTAVTPVDVAGQLGDEFAYPHIYINDSAVGVGTEGLCNIMATYEDSNTGSCAPGCNGGSKIIRRWTILDWCNSEVVEYHQVINLLDDEGPVLNVGTNVDTTTAANKCSIDVGLPAPAVLADFCGGESTYQVTGTSRGNSIVGNMTNGFAAYDLPVGDTDVYYVAADCCGNESYDTITVTVKDKVQPNAIAEEYIVVPMTILPDGTAWATVLALSVDNGSFDSCSDVVLEIRRAANHCESTDSSFGPSVSFCCNDMGASGFGEIPVELRVTDECGNFSIVSSNIRLQDHTTDALSCPAGMIVGCEDDISDLTVTGLPSKTGICGDIVLNLDNNQILNDTEPRSKSAGADPQYDVDGDGTPDMIPPYDADCGYGALRRQFRENGNVICTQFFVVVPDVFDPYSIVWPGDQTVGCSDFNLQVPTYVESACSSFGYSVESDTFATTDGSCYKLINTWTVIDWCKYNMTNGAEGSYSERQEVTIIDNSDPVIAVVSGSDFDMTEDNCLLSNLTLSYVATDADMCPTELLEWVVEVDYHDDGSVDVTRQMTSNPGDTLDLRLSSIPGSKSGHSVTYSAKDGCGNTGTTTSRFRVHDVVSPQPYCINLSTSVGDTGSFELWAIDFNGGTSDNCTADEDIRFTFSGTPPPAGQGYFNPVTGSSATITDYQAGTADSWDPVIGSAGRRFTDADLDSLNRLTLTIYVWDECGNFDFCIVNPVITDPNTGTGSISVQGLFTTETGQRIQGVETEIMTSLPDYPDTTMTDTDGTYAFPFNPALMDYQISAEKNDDPLNGISTVDLIRLQRIIIGADTLESPYQMIAADINSDKKIDGVDLVELRKLILGVYTELPESNSWKFVDESQELELANPWIYREVRNITGVDHDMMDENFIGVKIGDLDGSQTPNVIDQATDLRNNATLSFKYENAFVSGGETFLVEMSSDYKNLYGYQFSLSMDNLTFLDLMGKDLTAQNYNLRAEQLVVSHNSDYAIEQDENILTLRLKAEKDGWIDDLLQLNSTIAKAEAYVGNSFEVHNLVFDPYDGFELKQNIPNPFSDHTIIEYSLPKSGMVTFSLFDMSGRQLNVIQVYGQRGDNTLEISKAAIGQSGVIYYKLDCGEKTAIKRMLLIE